MYSVALAHEKGLSSLTGLSANEADGIRTRDLLIAPAVSTIGDFSGDGQVDAADIDMLNDAIRTDSTDLAMFDLSGNGRTLSPDGAINMQDLHYLVHSLVWTSAGTGTEYGDFNLDGAVDTTDLMRLAANFGVGDTWAEGNVSRHRDMLIDTTDLAILGTYYGFLAPEAGETAASSDALASPAAPAEDTTTFEASVQLAPAESTAFAAAPQTAAHLGFSMGELPPAPVASDQPDEETHTVAARFASRPGRRV